jgi:DNA-binding transcriptional LysR family regulator
MHAIDWSDLRYILALAEAKSFASAGRLLGANPTTVSRRLRIVEGMLQATLFQRDEAGDMQLTSAGEIAAARARIVEAEIGALWAALQNADAAVSGLVRVTAAPFIVN